MLKRDMIPYGRENAISRPELCRLTGLSDREVRRQIADLRAEDSDDDMVIASSSRRGRGYFLTDKPEDIRAFIAEMLKRIRMVYRAIKVAKKKLHRIEQREKYGKGLAG